jgi:ppGpp synthetase/RelA/SpoT-type nucleotidyltranferase
MKQQKKFAPSEQQRTSEVQSQQTMAREFASVEELLRYDAEQTTVPAEIVERLKRTTRSAAPPPRAGWLKRFFGGTNL